MNWLFTMQTWLESATSVRAWSTALDEDPVAAGGTAGGGAAAGAAAASATGGSFVTGAS